MCNHGFKVNIGSIHVLVILNLSLTLFFQNTMYMIKQDHRDLVQHSFYVMAMRDEKSELEGPRIFVRRRFDFLMLATLSAQQIRGVRQFSILVYASYAKNKKIILQGVFHCEDHRFHDLRNH